MKQYTELLSFEESFLKERLEFDRWKGGHKFKILPWNCPITQIKKLRLQNDQNVIAENCEEVKVMTVGFFESLFFEPKKYFVPSLDWNGRLLTEQQNNNIEAPITIKEI